MKKSYDFRLEVFSNDFQEAIIEIGSKYSFEKYSFLEISYSSNKINFKRAFDNEHYIDVNISAWGEWIGSITIFWRNFFDVFKKVINEDLVVNFYYNIKERKLFLNDTEVYGLTDGPAQFDLFTKEITNTPTINFSLEKETRKIEDDISKRIRLLDELNLENPPENIKALAKIYERDKVLSDLIKKYRGSKCQICGFSFKAKNGSDYTECHHLEHLANGGLDVSRNILLLCPNHHRQAHYGNFHIIEHNYGDISIEIDKVIYKCNF